MVQVTGSNAGRVCQFASVDEWDNNELETRKLVLEDQWYLPTGTLFREDLYNLEECTTWRNPMKVWKVILLCIPMPARARAHREMSTGYGYMAPERHWAQILNLCKKYVPKENAEWARRYFNSEVCFADNPIPPFDLQLLEKTEEELCGEPVESQLSSKT
jgi:hypothetical protein